jgi:endonuclease/exonuclease/phosphatase family metal-dependent hydrolase
MRGLRAPALSTRAYAMLTKWGAFLRRWRRRFSRAEWEVGRLKLPRTDAPSHTPGLLLIQIDGLGRGELERAIAAGRMPFLRRLIRREGYRLQNFYSGVPSTTPAVQGELFYGVRTAVPSFNFLDPRADSIGMMMQPEWAKRIEGDLAEKNEGLLRGGSSWSNIFTGGATQEDSHFCAASVGLGDLWRTNAFRQIFLFAFLHTPSFLRLLALLPLEFVIAVSDAIRGITRGFSWRREVVFIFTRVFICVGLRELVTLGAKVDLARGLPIIHVNFLGYDEQSHRRGPRSLFAHWTLRGIDRAIRLLHRSALRSEGRDYETWIFSDHGQVRSRPIHTTSGDGLEALVRRHWPDLTTDARGGAHCDRQYSTRVRLLGGPGRMRRAARDQARAQLSTFEKTEFAVACMGPVGHIYFKRQLPEEQVQQLIQALLADGVPGILRAETHDVAWHTREGVYRLPRDVRLLRGPSEIRAELAADLAALARHRYAGDLIALGWHPARDPLTFADENGSHGGVSPEEVVGFLMLPPACRYLLPEKTVRASDVREAIMIQLGRKKRPARAPRHPEDAPARGRMRVVTYNLHYCRGLDGRFAPERIARVLHDLHPDIVAVQEVDSGRRRSRGEDQLAYLADQLGMHACFCPSIEIGSERYGHGLLSRQPIEVRRRGRLPDGGRPRIEPRDAMAASTTFFECEILLFGTHLGLAGAERAAQIDFLLGRDWLGGVTLHQPAMFLGDLNLTPGGALYRRLVSPWYDRNGTATFRDVQAHAFAHVACKTFPSFFPVRRLDHIFVTPHFEVLHVEAPGNQLTRRASDHLPLVADLVLHA